MTATRRMSPKRRGSRTAEQAPIQLCLQQVLGVIDRVAPTDSTVLITGETGTGKELIAHAIHKGSPRSARALVKVNCAALPSELIASELFGHEKGAFTGADRPRQGLFEAANEAESEEEAPKAKRKKAASTATPIRMTKRTKAANDASAGRPSSSRSHAPATSSTTAAAGLPA